MPYSVHVKWLPRDLRGRFQRFDLYSNSLSIMTEIHEAIATLAASRAPDATGELHSELFLGGAGRGFVTPREAVIAAGDPYGPSQDTGYHAGPPNAFAGKYYSLAEWVVNIMGFEEEAIYPIAQSLDYSGTNFMKYAEEGSKTAVIEGTTKLIHRGLVKMFGDAG